MKGPRISVRSSIIDGSINTSRVEVWITQALRQVSRGNVPGIPTAELVKRGDPDTLAMVEFAAAMYLRNIAFRKEIRMVLASLLFNNDSL